MIKRMKDTTNKVKDFKEENLEPAIKKIKEIRTQELDIANPSLKYKNLNEKDYEFMHSLSAAVLQTTPNKLRKVLYFWVFAVFGFIIWANFAMIDEIVRGDGEIIPSGQNQMVQNLEGGIVKQILIAEGQEVKKGQVLIRIDNQKSQSNFSSNELQAKALTAKVIRLQAESSGQEFKVDLKKEIELGSLIDNERSLYISHKQQRDAKLSTEKEKLTQRQQELSEAKSHLRNVKYSYDIIQEEIKITEPMVLRGIKSKVEFLKLKREANDIEDKFNTVTKSIPRLESQVKEAQKNLEEQELQFRNKAKIELNETLIELQSLQADSTALKDQVDRTIVKSPMDGYVQRLYVHTLGGVIRPGADIVEIVPSGQALLVEVKVKPADIAFIHYDQKAKVKFSAYDFSIYGGLEGKVKYISADTIKDEKDNVFYTVRIKTDKNFLGSKNNPLKIIPGMTVNVDIITGKKSVLDYILKPIIKTKQYTFTER